MAGDDDDGDDDDDDEEGKRVDRGPGLVLDELNERLH